MVKDKRKRARGIDRMFVRVESRQESLLSRIKDIDRVDLKVKTKSMGSDGQGIIDRVDLGVKIIQVYSPRSRAEKECFLEARQHKVYSPGSRT
jgi:hypothetical protein